MQGTCDSDTKCSDSGVHSCNPHPEPVVSECLVRPHHMFAVTKSLVLGTDSQTGKATGKEREGGKSQVGDSSSSRAGPWPTPPECSEGAGPRVV